MFGGVDEKPNFEFLGDVMTHRTDDKPGLSILVLKENGFTLVFEFCLQSSSAARRLALEPIPLRFVDFCHEVICSAPKIVD